MSHPTIQNTVHFNPQMLELVMDEPSTPKPFAMDQTRTPKLWLPWALAIMTLSIPVFVLSIFNFGLLSRWYNGALGAASFVFCILFLILRWREKKAIKAAMDENPQSSEEGSISKVEQDLQSKLDFPFVHSLFTLIPFLIVAIGHFIAFVMMVDITVKGAVKSTLPAERDPKVTYPWNIKIQIAQTGVIGLQMVVTAAFVMLSYRGRAAIAEEMSKNRETRDAGFDGV